MAQETKKKVVITGATGLLGRQVVRAFDEADWEVVGTGLSRAQPPKTIKVDLTNEEEIDKLLSETKPTIVIHCAAERSPDKCANDPTGTKQLNITTSGTLASKTAALGIPIVYISTDYVFDGAQGAAPYAANAEPNPPNFYGETKLDGEKAVLEASPLGVVLRVPLLYGSGDNEESTVNVLMDAIWNKSGKESVEMDHWAIRYPTNTEDVARVLKDIAEKYTSASNPASLPKVLQFSSEDSCTKYEICQRLSQILGLPMQHIVANDSVDPNASVKRPYDCHLSTQELKDLGISVAAVDFEAWWKRELRAFR